MGNVGSFVDPEGAFQKDEGLTQDAVELHYG